MMYMLIRKSIHPRYLPIVEEALRGLDLPKKMPVIVRQVSVQSHLIPGTPISAARNHTDLAKQNKGSSRQSRKKLFPTVI